MKPGTSHRSRVALRALGGSIVILAGLLSTPARAEDPDPFEACEAAFEGDREDWKTCGCFRTVGLRHDRLPQAIQRLEDHLEADPENPCLQFYLGRLKLRFGEASAQALLGAAAEGYRARGEVAGETYARLNLIRLYSRQRRLDAAREEVEKALESLHAHDEPLLQAEVELHQAQLWMGLGEDLERIDRLLRGVEAKAFPGGSLSLRRGTLMELGNVRRLRGRPAEAETFFRRMVEVTREADDTWGETTARWNLAATHGSRLPTPGAREEVAVLLREAVAAAVASGHRAIEAEARGMLGKLLDGAEGRRELARSLGLARQLPDPAPLARSLGRLAAELAGERPVEARRHLDEARAVLASLPPAERFFGSTDRMQVDWQTLPRDEAVERALGELRQIERLRALQRSATGRAESFTVWSESYYWLAGRLYEAAESTGRRDLERAFSVTESLRARVLLEALQAGPATAREDHVPRREGAAVREDLVAVNRRLLDPDLGPEERAAALDELERLERREAELRHRMAPAAGVAPLARPGFATVSEVEQALADNEALLSFQVAQWQNLFGDFEGGSWLQVSTRSGTRVYRLPDRTRLEPAIKVFRNLFARRDGLDTGPAVSLYGDLLAAALAQLPAAIDRLVIVPDGHLHLLPFGALRAAESSAPLAAVYQLSMVPSATLWLRWRQAAPVPAPGVALALADPMLAAGSALRQAALERGWSRGVRFDPLPQARREGRALVRYLGPPSELLVGDEASESALKARDARRFSVVHFAAHAFFDSENPRRSAVVLAPGSPAEDGLLQPREIAGLDLDDTLVVLSTCQSASGNALAGEGPLSLARAFFEAGARTVVASLWPIRDDEAAALFEPFYRQLGRGASVAESLGAAQRERIAAAAPAAAWAGVIVLGDGALVLRPGGRSRAWPMAWVLALATGAAILAVIAGARRRRRPARSATRAAARPPARPR